MLMLSACLLLHPAPTHLAAQDLLVDVAGISPQLFACSLDPLVSMLESDDPLLANCAIMILSKAARYLSPKARSQQQQRAGGGGSEEDGAREAQLDKVRAGCRAWGERGERCWALPACCALLAPRYLRRFYRQAVARQAFRFSLCSLWPRPHLVLVQVEGTLLAMCSGSSPSVAKAAVFALVTLRGAEHAEGVLRPMCATLMDSMKQPSTLSNHPKLLTVG